MNNELFPPEFLQLLAAGSAKPLPSTQLDHVGCHGSRRTGDSQEFQDFRAYTPGDDMRYLDWNSFRRTGKLFMKRYRHEPRAHHRITLDGSASMRFSPQRAFSAWRVAALLGARLLHCGDHVALHHGTRRIERIAPGSGAVWAWCEALSRLFAAPVNNTLAFSGHERGHHWIISDFYDPRGIEHLAEQLRYAHFTPVRIFDAEEVSPLLGGACALVDAETGERIVVHAEAGVMARYLQAWKSFEALLEQCGHRAGSRLYRVETASDYVGIHANFHREFSPREG